MDRIAHKADTNTPEADVKTTKAVTKTARADASTAAPFAANVVGAPRIAAPLAEGDAPKDLQGPKKNKTP